MWRRRWLGAALVAVVLGTGCSDGKTDTATTTPAASVPCGATATKQYAVHDGVDANLNSLDIYLPPAGEDDDCTGRPLVVWVHGGGWHEGDKTDDIGDKVRLFTGAGYAFASVNYRLTDVTLEPPAPQYPVHDQDTADAVAWLVAHADALGVDAHQIALLGHSAGGGIVAAITTDDRYLGAVDSISTRFGARGQSMARATTSSSVRPTLTHGCTTPTSTRSETDPATWEVASPMNHIAKGTGIPAYFVAARGPEGRLDLHAEFVAALRAADVPTTVLDARNSTMPRCRSTSAPRATP